MNYFNLDEIKPFLITGILGLFGSLVHVLYQHVKGIKKISFIYAVISLIIGFFVGNLVGSFIPETFEYRDGILMMAGFGCYPVLNAIEIRVLDVISRIPGLGKIVKK